MLQRRTIRNSRTRPTTYRPAIESLESRSMFATFAGFDAPALVDGCGFPPAQVAVGDLNKDGIPDLVTADNGTMMVKVSLGRGDGTFAPPTSLSTPGNNVRDPLIADFNGDGQPDIAVTSQGMGRFVRVMLGNGNGTFQPPKSSLIGGSYPVEPVVADMNNDRILDLVFADIGVNPSTSRAYSTGGVAYGRGDGTFRSGLKVQLSLDRNTDENVKNVAVGDFNGDGRPDMVFTHRGAGVVSVVLNNGNETFQNPRRIAVGTSEPNGVRTGDFNRDGRTDFAFTKVRSNAISVAMGNGAGSFTLRDYAVGTSPEQLAIGDMNRDSIVDIVIANRGSDNVTLLGGMGDGTFQTVGNYSAGNGSDRRIDPSDIELADLDRDGQTDAVLGNGHQGTAFDNWTNKSTAVGVLLTKKAAAQSNLKITGLSLRDENGNSVFLPRNGQRLYAAVTFETTGLPTNARYTVSVQSGDHRWNYNLTWGAGLNGTGSWLLQTGTFVYNGENFLSATLDSTGVIAESSESDNSISRVIGLWF